jgi:uncharacterized membrane protein
MPGPDQSEELQRLREQLAGLTRRVYQLERLLAAHSAEASPTTAGEEPPVISEAGAAPSAFLATPTTSPQAVPSPPQSSANQQRVSLHAAVKPSGTSANKISSPAANKVSLELRVGGQWLNRIGIVAVLVGLSYFLKLAFENNWIGPATQVLIGLAAGLAILFWSERFRSKGYPGFAYSLKALGIGALYLSLWAASQYYHLAPPTVTFFGMVLVTMTSAGLSLRQNSELLAGFALVGGFLTPVLVSTGENHEVALFCYIALLDLGTAWVVAIKGWRRLLLGSFVGTALLFAAWASSYFTEPQLATTLAFATFFFLLYAATPFLRTPVTESSSSQNIAVALAVLNAALYFAASYLLLERHYRFELAWLSVALAAFFFAFTRLLQRRTGISGALYDQLYLALGVGFLTVAIPLKLGEHWLTLGWLAEAAALFWAAHRSRSFLLRLMGMAALALGVARLIVVDSGASQDRLLLNPRFGLYLVAIGALALLTWVTLREGGSENRQWAAGAILALNMVALLAAHFEVIDWFTPLPGAILTSAELRSLHTVRDFTYSAVWMIYGSGLMLIGFWKRSAFLRWQAIVLLGLTTAKVFFYDIEALERGYRIVAFIVLGAILLAVSFFYQRSRIKSAE